jgi:co-chaperonin GroES (HSP10)
MAISAADLKSAFPEVHAGEYPCGPRVLVQLQTIREKTQGGIVLVEETREVNKNLTQIGKIVAMGQIAFCNRETGNRWPEGVWAKIGDLVRVPRYVGQRFNRPIPDSKDTAAFIILDDHQVVSVVDHANFDTVSELL